MSFLRDTTEKLYFYLTIICNIKGRVLNYTRIKLLYNIETKGIKFSSIILPSRITLQRYAQKVELIANNLCPVQQW